LTKFAARTLVISNTLNGDASVRLTDREKIGAVRVNSTTLNAAPLVTDIPGTTVTILTTLRAFTATLNTDLPNPTVEIFYTLTRHTRRIFTDLELSTISILATALPLDTHPIVTKLSCRTIKVTDTLRSATDTVDTRSPIAIRVISTLCERRET
jgi:hypothetical protein